LISDCINPLFFQSAKKGTMKGRGKGKKKVKGQGEKVRKK